jgi:hypothetical protein
MTAIGKTPAARFFPLTACRARIVTSATWPSRSQRSSCVVAVKDLQSGELTAIEYKSGLRLF